MYIYICARNSSTKRIEPCRIAVVTFDSWASLTWYIERKREFHPRRLISLSRIPILGRRVSVIALNGQLLSTHRYRPDFDTDRVQPR